MVVKTKTKSKKSGGDAEWKKELAKRASKDNARETNKGGGGGAGNRISTKNGRFSFNDELLDPATKGRSFKGVVVDFVHLRTYYTKQYKEGQVNIPTCFALSDDGENMKPHDNSTKKQARKCEACPHAEFDRGSPAECRERRRMGIIHEDDLDNIAEATVGIMEIPPTSLKFWGRFTKNCDAKHSIPFYAALIEFEFNLDGKQPVPEFNFVEELTREQVEAIDDRRAEVQEMLMTPYSAEEDEEDEKPKSKKRKAAKEEDDEDDEDEEDEGEEDEDESEEDESEEDEEDDSEDDDDADEDGEDDGEEPPPRRRGKKPARRNKRAADDEDSDDDDEEEVKPKKKKGSRFGRK